MAGDTLSSIWSGLHPSLLASIYAVDARGEPLADSPVVLAPLTDATIELAGNWQSPFEQSGPDSKAPAIMAMAQSGQLESYVTPILGKGTPGDEASFFGRMRAEITSASRQAQGRTGMTKLNSSQIFNGAPPAKITGTLHFRAFRDAKAEVRTPLDQLAQWILARSLAPNGNLVSALQAFKDGQGFIKALLPSEAPQMVGLTYGGYTFSPMVLETLSRPLTVPRTSEGLELNVSVPLSLSSLTALDAGDWRRAMAGRPTVLFGSAS